MNKKKETKTKITNQELLFMFKEMIKNAGKLEEAEKTLNKVYDLINSNEDLVHFDSTRKEIRKPIEDYFKKVK